MSDIAKGNRLKRFPETDYASGHRLKPGVSETMTKKRTKTRAAEIRRKTKETDIRVSLALDGRGTARISTGVAFLDHMLELFAKHGLFDLEITCKGDLLIDDHHSVEDIAICLGEAFHSALGDKAGIARYGESVVPMDEALWRSFAEKLKCNLHIDLLRGRNTHHILEASFKSTARAVKQSVQLDSRIKGVLST